MKDTLRIGIFGGSFDPVHCGHLQLADLAREEMGLDRVIFVPARQPPHKKDRRLTPVRHRLKMLSLALAPFPSFRISRFEVSRSETTYTYQTVDYFRKRFPSARFFFILGTDSLADLSTWRNSDRLAGMTEFVAGPRAGVPPVAFKGTVHLLSRQILAVSSSEVREKLKDGRPLEGLVPEAVARYARDHRLYSPGPDTEKRRKDHGATDR